jgi:hypothetical protein
MGSYRKASHGLWGRQYPPCRGGKKEKKKKRKGDYLKFKLNLVVVVCSNLD